MGKRRSGTDSVLDAAKYNVRLARGNLSEASIVSMHATAVLALRLGIDEENFVEAARDVYVLHAAAAEKRSRG